MDTAETTAKRDNSSDLLAAYFKDDPLKPAFEPIGVEPHYRPAGVRIDPDMTKGWLKRILPVVLNHRRLVIGSLSIAFLALLIQVAVPAVIRSTIDEGLIDRSSPLLPFIYWLLGLGICRGILTFLYRYGMNKITFSLEYDLRTIIYDHMTQLSFSFYDRIQSGQLISRANSDIRAVQRFLTQGPLLAMSVCTFAFAFTYMMSLHVKLTLAAVFCLPGVYIAGRYMRKIMFPLSWIIQSRLADVTTIVDENINGVRVVKSFAAERQQITLLAEAAEGLRWANIQAIDLRSRFNPIISNLPRLGLALVIFYGGHLAIEGQVTIGTLVAFSSYVVMLQAPFRMLAMFLVMNERAKASAERIYEILDERSEIVESPSAVDLVNPRGGIEFRDVSFSYRQGPRILHHFNLKIEPGEALAVVGRTGSGKSTLTRLLTRFYDADSGTIAIDGRDHRELSIVSLRATIGMVLDEPFLFSVSVGENIAYGRPDATMGEIVTASRAAGAHEFISALSEGYDSIIGERGYTLSGGQRQRIAIARTLLVQPKILVLDDATSAVDVQVEAQIHDALKHLMKDRTTIVIAHRLSTIMLADRVVLVEDGRVVASGTHSQLMSGEPRYVEVLTRAEEEEKRLREQRAEHVTTSQEPIVVESPGEFGPDDDTDSYGGQS
ncbi:MAG: ABC transporter ATP-binding protein [Desulfobacterales bacterium]